MEQITFPDFKKVDIRLGEIVEVQVFFRNPETSLQAEN
jgi:hypothetical protein